MAARYEAANKASNGTSDGVSFKGAASTVVVAHNFAPGVSAGDVRAGFWAGGVGATSPVVVDFPRHKFPGRDAAADKAYAEELKKRRMEKAIPHCVLISETPSVDAEISFMYAVDADKAVEKFDGQQVSSPCRVC